MRLDSINDKKKFISSTLLWNLCLSGAQSEKTVKFPNLNGLSLRRKTFFQPRDVFCFCLNLMDSVFNILCFSTKLIQKKGWKQNNNSKIIAIVKNTCFFYPHSKKSHKEADRGWGRGGEIGRVRFCPRKKLKYTFFPPLRANLKCEDALCYKMFDGFSFANTTDLAVTGNLEKNIKFKLFLCFF